MSQLCFVLMPFGKGSEYLKGKRESNFVFEHIIKPAVLEAVEEVFGSDKQPVFKVIRELDDTTPGSITKSIIQHIAEADICIADLTGRNPNVFFELGVRYTLSNTGTVLMVQNVSEIPFNVQQYRVIEYDPFSAEEARSGLKSAVIRSLQARSDITSPPSTDSLVYQSLPDLQVIEGSASTRERSVTWSEYWVQVEKVRRVLSEARSSGWYEPDILVGISNGGLFLADTLLRLVYNNDTPLVCLWAHRTDRDIFSNSINDALITPSIISELAGVKSIVGTEKDTINLLVMDDIVSTGRTSRELLHYLEHSLKELWSYIDIKFLFLYTPVRERLTELGGRLLWEDQRIPESQREVLRRQVLSTKVELPYRKSIHSGEIIDRLSGSDTDAR